MPRKDRVHFDLRVGSISESDVEVRRLHGVEDVSNTFCFEVDFIPMSGEAIDLAPLLEADAKLCLRRPSGEERWVNGICTYADLTSVEAGKPAYQVTIEPKIVLLGRRQCCRVYQNQTAPEIVKAVLDERGISHRLSLSKTYPKRDLCIQYRETDLAFVSRLLEDEGIAWWFEHSESDHVMVLGDASSSFTKLPGGEQVPHRAEKALLDDEAHLYALRCTEELRQGKVVVRGFDFQRPTMNVVAESSEGKGKEVYDYPAGAYPPAEGKRISRTRLDELRVGTKVWSGEGTCERFAAGCTFEVVDHSRDAFGGRRLLLHVEHDGRQQSGIGDVAGIHDGYRNRFRAIEATAPFRPPRSTPRPVIGGPQTATVVGPSGEEIHVDGDGQGRIKVQFHWDREGKRDEKASAWVRLAQAWGGPGFGALFVPRIGQEVLVRFLEGNPDRPLVCGAIFNGQNAVPVPLPDHRTQSTLRTDSSPHSGGYNELRFEDVKDGEQIHLHGQKDELVEVLNDKRQTVKANEELRVEKDRTLTVKGMQSLEVKGNDESEVKGNQTRTVTGNRTTRVYADHTEEISGSNAVTVGGSRMLTVFDLSNELVGAASALTVGGAYAIQVAGAINEAVGGALIVTVGGARIEVVGAARDEQVGKNSSARVGGDFATEVVKELKVQVGKDLSEDVTASTGIETPKPFQLMAKKIQLEATDLSIIVGGKKAVSMKASGAIVLGGSSITVTGQAVTLKGAKIAKSGPAGPPGGSSQVKRLKPLPGDRAQVSIKLADQHGKAFANEPFRVELPGGTVRTGRLDGSGGASVPGSKEGNAKVTFPNLDKNAWKKG